jgi:tetratricopeptide (TPR) repeat protein
MKYSKEGNKLEQSASRFLAPKLFTTLGSMLASSSIGQSGSISQQALTWFSTGLESSDVSDRLKLASMFYCTGDMRAEITLRNIAQQFDNDATVPLCTCYSNCLPEPNPYFFEICNDQNESSIQHYIARCVQFQQSEKNCVPPELRYEMFRSTEDELLHREDLDMWMNWAVIDSLPFLYFLQYKVYSRQQKYQDQQQALHDLIWIIDTNENLRHKETDLNLLGQLMEQANRPKDALQCYMMSLQIRSRNNAARFHVCRLLATLATRRFT